MSSKTALLIIDVQNDFCEGGTLAVPGGKSVVEPINDLIHNGSWDLIVASKDWHPPAHVSFASNHEGKKPFDSYELTSRDTGVRYSSTLWPAHCVQHTHGAAIVDGLDMSKVNTVVLKGEDASVEFYSAFIDMFRQKETDLLSVLRDHSITKVVVVGLAYDFCVMHTAVDAAAAGFDTTVDLRCTRAISKEGAEHAERKLVAAGVHITNK